MVLGIGNPGRADDGVGALIAGRLADRLPADVTLVVRSGDIVTLVETWAEYGALICVDAANPMGQPGRVHRLEGPDDALAESSSLTSSHGFCLADAIALARELRTLPETLVIYAVEGACFDIGAPMTPQVAKAAADVAEQIIEEVDRLSCVEARATM
ncbi:hydrogenase maturation protease [Bradyrhizobium sp.]|uniref:hydrogenase maturation protease n=1 Tax=Bradyrhizobium sp. TaxID=376 RepID=UPI0026245119|nr:hydrogenase maturation protease [Bradyrhizobium sp.]